MSPVSDGTRPVAARRRDGREHHVLITGGAGFVGTNLADHFATAGERVVVLDNLSRPGVSRNADWLVRQHGNRVRVEESDVRDPLIVQKAVQRARAVYHLAAQVAVTTSLSDPCLDFQVNAQGTLNVLEALRALRKPPPLVFTSTNKVYGALGELSIEQRAQRYVPADERVARFGVGEDTALDFHSPYGCSKGSADQYVLDYARSYGLPAVVLRMSCIYGPHQWGNEDQGWVAHFLRRVLARQPIVIYGDGRQVRDLLFIGDLVTALDTAVQRIDELAGRAFNIGGGPANATSLIELLDLMSHAFGVEPRVRHAGWRQGDQRYYVSDTRRFRSATSWRPHVSVQDGVRRLHDWIREAAREKQSVQTAGAAG